MNNSIIDIITKMDELQIEMHDRSKLFKAYYDQETEEWREGRDAQILRAKLTWLHDLAWDIEEMIRELARVEIKDTNSIQ